MFPIVFLNCYEKKLICHGYLIQQMKKPRELVAGVRKIFDRYEFSHIRYSVIFHLTSILVQYVRFGYRYGRFKYA